MAVQIQWRRDTAANWTSVDPLLAQGEIGYETDTGNIKIGSGLSNWTSLPYFTPGTSVTSAELASEISNRISADDALSNAISALELDDLADVSAPTPADGNVLMWNSAQAQWLDSAMGGGSGSVTSADFVSLRSDVGRLSVSLSGAISSIVANSAQMTSADNANSAAAAAVSARLDSTNTVVSNQGSAIVANSAQMTSADNAISAAVNVVSANLVSLRSDVGRISLSVSAAISAIAANSAQMTSADNANSAAAAAVSARLDSTNTVVSNQGSAIVANSAQMTSADNAISAAVNVVSAAHASLVSDVGRISVSLSGAISTIAANSAQMVSADNAISAAAANATSIGNAVSNRLSTWTLDNLADVSAPSPVDGNVLAYNSAAGQWVASTMAAGVGSVTSAEVSAVSAAAASADATLSARIDSVMTVVSNQGSAIVANSAQMISADNAISAAAAAVSARLDSTNTVVSNQGSAIVANSAALTSVASIASAAASAVNALSVNFVSLRSDVGRLSLSVSALNSVDAALSARLDSTQTVVSNQGSAIVANSAALTSVASIASAAASAVNALSVNFVSLRSDVGRLSLSVSAALSAIAANSAQMTSADNAISAAAAAVSARLDSTNTVVSNAVSAIQANSAQMVSADNAISNRLSTWTLDNLANVSVPSPADANVLAFNSAAGKWLATAVAAGAASVTSAEYTSLVDRVSLLSGSLTSVASIASAAASAVSAAVSNHVSLVSDVGRISLSVSAAISAIDAISQRLSALVLDSIANVSAPTPSDTQVLAWSSAQAQWINQSFVAGVDSVTSTEYTSLVNRVSTNSAQMTSADNAISAAVNALSVNFVSLRSDVGRLSLSVSQQTSAIVANSAQMTSADNAISNQIVSVTPIKRYLQGDQLLTASAAVSLSGFTFTVGNAPYRFEFGICEACTISTAGLKIHISVPAGAVGVVDIINMASPAATQRTTIALPMTTLQFVTCSNLGATICWMRGVISMNGTGTVALALGNNVSGGSSAIQVFSGRTYGYLWAMNA